MNIYQKLIEVRKAVPYLQKETKGFQYNYVSSSQVLSAVRVKMDEVGLLLIPRILDVCVNSKTVDSEDKYGNPKKTTTYFTELTMEFTWVDIDNPDDTIVCSWYGQGIDTEGEKGVGKALTYAEKYFLLKTFNIATDKDDPDAFQERGQGNNSAPSSKKLPNKGPTLNDTFEKVGELGFTQQEMVVIMKREWGKDASSKLNDTEISELNEHVNNLFEIKILSGILEHDEPDLINMPKDIAVSKLSELNKEKEAVV